jgi:hypothetical protein
MTPQRSDLQLAPFPDAGDAIPAGADRTDCHIGVTRINRDTIAAASRGAGATSSELGAIAKAAAHRRRD